MQNMPRKKTNEEFINELRTINPKIEVLDYYINSDTKIKVKCLDCSNEWDARPSDLLRGHGCMNCAAKKRVVSRTKSYEEFCAELQSVNPNITIQGEYINTHTYVAYKCKVCGFEGFAKPYSLLQGHGCPECYKNNPREKCRKPAKQFIEELAFVNNSIVAIEKYSKSNKRIRVQCKNCNHVWSATPNALLRGAGCPMCHRNTQTSFVEQFIFFALSSVFGKGNVLNRDVTAIGSELDIYVPSIKLAFEPGSWFWHKNKLKEDEKKREKCLNCGIRLITIYDSFDEPQIIEKNDIFCFYEDLGVHKNHYLLLSLLTTILDEYGVDSSSITYTSIAEKARNASRRRTTKEFVEILVEVNSDIEVIGDYRSSKDPIECSCKVCGHNWSPAAGSLLVGQGCPICGRNRAAEKLKLTNAEFLKRVDAINPNIQILGTYKKSSEKLSVRCKVCTYEWQASPSHLMIDAKCPKCSNNIRRSTQYFVDEMKDINPTVEILGVYSGRKNKILVRCIECGSEWYPTPNNLLKGSGCPNCKKINNSITIKCVETGEIFNSIKLAAKSKGISSSSISNSLSGRIATAGSYHWIKLDEA